MTEPKNRAENDPKLKEQGGYVYKPATNNEINQTIKELKTRGLPPAETK